MDHDFDTGYFAFLKGDKARCRRCGRTRGEHNPGPVLDTLPPDDEDSGVATLGVSPLDTLNDQATGYILTGDPELKASHGSYHWPGLQPDLPNPQGLSDAAADALNRTSEAIAHPTDFTPSDTGSAGGGSGGLTDSGPSSYDSGSSSSYDSGSSSSDSGSSSSDF
jgi:hypothetical protein